MIKKQYNIIDKNIVLYAPTFRKDFSFGGTSIDFKKLKEELKRKFGGDWVVLIKLHPMIASKFKNDDENIIDVSFHEDMQELLCASDILISDYSSCMWDFALMRKPIFVFADDIEEYTKKDRAFYMPVEKWPYPVAENNEQLLNNIEKFNKDNYLNNLNSHFDFVGCFDYGNSCKEILNYINKK